MVPRNPFAPTMPAPSTGARAYPMQRARNPFAPAMTTSTGAILGPSAQTVNNAVAILSQNMAALLHAVNDCAEKDHAAPTHKIDLAMIEQFELFLDLVTAFVDANKDANEFSISLADILAQVDQLQAQLDAWRARFGAVCPGIADIPQAPPRANTDTPLFSLPTGLIVGSAIVLGILIVWKV